MATMFGAGNDRFGNDIRHIEKALRNSKCEVTSEINLTNNALFEEIEDAFGGTTSDDVSLFFFAGHGGYNSQGTPVLQSITDEAGNNETRIEELAEALSNIKGKKIILLSSCHSGEILNYLDQNDPDLYIITASRHDESSWGQEAGFFGNEELSKNEFSYALALALGAEGTLEADFNSDGVVFFNELAGYLQDTVNLSTVVASAMNDFEIINNIRYETITDIDAIESETNLFYCNNNLQYITYLTNEASTWEEVPDAKNYHVLLLMKPPFNVNTMAECEEKDALLAQIISSIESGDLSSQDFEQFLADYGYFAWIQTNATSLSPDQISKGANECAKQQGNKHNSFYPNGIIVFYEK